MHCAHQPTNPNAMPGRGCNQASNKPALQQRMLNERQVRARGAWLQSGVSG